MAAKQMGPTEDGNRRDFIGTKAEQATVEAEVLALNEGADALGYGSTYWAKDEKKAYIWDGAWNALT